MHRSEPVLHLLPCCRTPAQGRLPISNSSCAIPQRLLPVLGRPRRTSSFRPQTLALLARRSQLTGANLQGSALQIHQHSPARAAGFLSSADSPASNGRKFAHSRWPHAPCTLSRSAENSARTQSRQSLPAPAAAPTSIAE